MKSRLFAMAVGAGILGLAAFGAPQGARAADPITVGVIANLTGTDVKSSTDMVHGVELAVHRLRRQALRARVVRLVVRAAELDEPVDHVLDGRVAHRL